MSANYCKSNANIEITHFFFFFFSFYSQKEKATSSSILLKKIKNFSYRKCNMWRGIEDICGKNQTYTWTDLLLEALLYQKIV